MNAFTIVAALLVSLVVAVASVGIGWVFYGLSSRLFEPSGIDPQSERTADRPSKSEPDRPEKRYEITRIVHKQPGPEFGQPIQYSGFAQPIFDSCDPGTGVGVPPDETSAVDRSGFDGSFDELKQRIETLQRHEDEIRRIADRAVRKREERRPDGEEDGPAEGSPEEGRTYRPGEVRGPDSINEIRFGGI